MGAEQQGFDQSVSEGPTTGLPIARRPTTALATNSASRSIPIQRSLRMSLTSSQFLLIDRHDRNRFWG
jgi:hypothetical protein